VTVTEHRYAIRGYISTVVKHGADIMTAIRGALCGRPWTVNIQRILVGRWRAHRV
jgi:hypothetical protein